ELAPPFGLVDLLDRPVGTYSGGQRRRLEIARSLLSDPEVLFLDEPTVGLDPRIRYELLDLIAGLRDRSGMTVVLTTHYLDEAERLCDRIAIVHEGRIVALDTPARLLAGVGAEVLELRVDGDPDQALATLRAEGIAGDDAIAVGATLTVPVHDRSDGSGRSRGDAIAALTHLGIGTGAVTARRPTLDDVYLRLTGTRLAA
ncbi:MAG TPA: ATP-binding cassette domain-containing protein, partial [Acidimicrobiales bacterium]|nr:ATP-binding cassette domain-containing protein [Acidimicrobiales bacterium]